MYECEVFPHRSCQFVQFVSIFGFCLEFIGGPRWELPGNRSTTFTAVPSGGSNFGLGK